MKATPVPDRLQQNLGNARQQMLFNRNSLSTLQTQRDQLASEYAEDLQRYRQLRPAD